MSSYLKKKIRKIFRIFGLELSLYYPSNSSAAQLVKALDVAGINIVFDIGANEGQFAREIREYGYTGKIVSFEPLSAARKKLLTFAYADPAWEVHDQSAIGDQNGEIDIHISGNSVSSSVLPMLESHSSAALGSAYIDSERVSIAKLDSIASRYLTLESNLFIKIDTQGFEWQVLDGALETLKRALGVCCELSLVPLYDGQRLWRDITDRLDSEGLMLWALQKGFTNPRTLQSLQVDGIFLRKDMFDSLTVK
jgi:FkbM family methyltransferase